MVKMKKKITFLNRGVPQNFKNLITEAANNVIDDVYTYPGLTIELLVGPKSVEDVEPHKMPVFAKANTFDFLHGEEPRIIVSTAILWYVQSLEAITGTVAHEMAHLELVHEYGPDVLTIQYDPFVSHISNIWSDYYVNSYLVKRRLGPALLSRLWEVGSGNVSLFILAVSRQKPITRQLRRDYLIHLIVDLSELASLFLDDRTSQFAKNEWDKIIKAAMPILGKNSVVKARKLVSKAEKTSVQKWVRDVLFLIQKQK